MKMEPKWVRDVIARISKPSANSIEKSRARKAHRILLAQDFQAEWSLLRRDFARSDKRLIILTDKQLRDFGRKYSIVAMDRDCPVFSSSGLREDIYYRCPRCKRRHCNRSQPIGFSTVFYCPHCTKPLAPLKSEFLIQVTAHSTQEDIEQLRQIAIARIERRGEKIPKRIGDMRWDWEVLWRASAGRFKNNRARLKFVLAQSRKKHPEYWDKRVESHLATLLSKALSAAKKSRLSSGKEALDLIYKAHKADTPRLSAEYFAVATGESLAEKLVRVTLKRQVSRRP